MVRVDLRTITLNIQDVITKDNVPAQVNAVAYFRIVEPKAAIVQIENFMVATLQIAQTTLHSVLGPTPRASSKRRSASRRRRSSFRTATPA
jgi:regulator of protease activity HflC (stomatin/prohibitin superfamily)